MNDDEKLLMQLLLRTAIVHEGFIGSVTIHIGPGLTLCDIAKTETGLKTRLRSLSHKGGQLRKIS